jgi:predicted component of type VI protein secretion system
MKYPATACSHEVIGQDGRLTGHDWRVSRLTRLGLPSVLAAVYADRLDWHQIARLVQRGCPPLLALRIAR